MKNGHAVAAFERAFAEYVGAEYAIALNSGTATLHTALVALGVKPGDRVAVPPLTMSSTSIAVLHAGGVPVYVDVDPDTWVIEPNLVLYPRDSYRHAIPVNLYGLWINSGWPGLVRDAAQTLRKHHEDDSFTSYSFQASKVLATGEGGMLVTDCEDLATRAREFSSLGYRMRADQPRIDPAVLKHPTYERHHTLGQNYRMADEVAKLGRIQLSQANWLLDCRRRAAKHYADAVKGCSWIKPQHVPHGWTHDYWTFAVALESAELWEPFTHAIVRHGGEMPYGAWRLTYQEPAFRHLAEPGTCPVAEDLHPRLVQFQTNSVPNAQGNAEAVSLAIKEING